MRIAVTGASGLVGTALREQWASAEITPLVRSYDEPGVRWDPAAGTIDAAGLEGQDAVVHLAGENLATGRWTKKKKARILDSRAKGTALLAEALAGLEQKPAVLVSASAIGIYGNRYGEVLREYADLGGGFLAEVCRAWEAATKPAEDAGIRVVHARTGLVLSTRGGPLKKMLLPFKLGLGGRIGKGDQYMSWVHIDDMVNALRHCITTEVIEGPVNIAAPNPVTNREFTKAFGKALKRPTIFPMPAIAARLAFGELADEALLSGQRVDPERLRQTNFEFLYTDLDAALGDLLQSGA